MTKNKEITKAFDIYRKEWEKALNRACIVVDSKLYKIAKKYFK